MKKSKKRYNILFCVSNFHPQFGGIGRHIAAIITELEKSYNIRCKILTTYGTFSSQLSDEYWEKKTIIAKNNFDFIINLIQCLRKKKFSLIHIHGYQTWIPFLTQIITRFFHIPIIFTPHYHPFGSHNKLIRSIFDILIGSFVFNTVDKCIVLTQFEKINILTGNKFHIAPERFIIINNIISSIFFEKSRNLERFDRFSIIFVGRPEKYKGFGNVLDIFIELINQKYLMNLIVVTPLIKPVEEIIYNKLKKNEIFKSIYIYERIDDNKLIELYSKCHITILLSSYEATGLTLIESLSCGTPVLAYDVGGVNSVIKNDKIGFLIRFGDGKNVIKSLTNIYNSRTLYFDNKLIKYRMKYSLKYSPIIVCKRIYNIYIKEIDKCLY